MKLRFILILVIATIAGVAVFFIPRTVYKSEDKTLSFAPEYAAIIMHADTGKILINKSSRETRFPASLVKMMTLYLTFEAIEKGQRDFRDTVTVSAYAASMPRLHLGLKEGEQVMIRTLIDAIIIRSANDAAVVLAEILAGSEKAFAEKMNLKAQELHMQQTVFRNASGLPDEKQITTAHDMAILARAIINDFPWYYHLFAKKDFFFRGKKIYTHNRFLFTYPGAEGMKTGFINASGFNLAATAQQSGNKLIGIVMGMPSSDFRDAHMAELMDSAFSHLSP